MLGHMVVDCAMACGVNMLVIRITQISILGIICGVVAVDNFVTSQVRASITSVYLFFCVGSPQAKVNISQRVWIIWIMSFHVNDKRT